MFDVQQLVKSPKLSAHLIIGEVQVNEQKGLLSMDRSNLTLTLIIFLVLLVAFLLFIVAVAIHGQMSRKTVKCPCAAPNVTAKSAPKFSVFDDSVF